jgi:serine/threonine-protein kinase
LALNPGTRLGPYEITSLLGVGGMGEVYRATDTNLKRQVAIKVLPAAVAGDSERLARFQREAEILAALNHPNISHIHGLEKADGTIALVMELVEGPTLADRIAKGAIPIDEALPIARQIAEALEAAHEQGIIHRDLKPGNIKVQRDGTVKLLDFGLAKALEPGRTAPGATALSTIGPMTAQGAVVGTAGYMAPEQANGTSVDQRVDVWAFGCVMFEMLTGTRTFEGQDLLQTLTAVIKSDPDWARLPHEAPSTIRRLLKRCLAKDRGERLQAIGDARLEIDDALRGADGPGPARAAPSTPHFQALVFAAGVGLLGGIVVTALVMRGGQPRGVAPPQTGGVARVLVSLAPADQLLGNSAVERLTEGRPSRTAFALSSDGRSLVFSAVQQGHQQLFFRALDQLEATPIPGTEGAMNPFLSPDGRQVGFFAGGAIKKLTLPGGAGATVVCETPTVFGATWGTNDMIVFASQNSALLQVPAAGGTPQPITRLDTSSGELSHRLPHWLPGNKAVLFTVTEALFPKWEDTHIVMQTLGTGARTDLGTGADAHYVSTGHIVYVRGGVLMAAPFDLERLTVTGGAVSVVPDVMQAAYMPNTANDSGAGQFDVSASGSLVYIKGGVFPDLQRALVWIDRTGASETLTAPLGPYYAPRLSPDGKRVLTWTSGKDRNIWSYDLERGTLAPLTVEGRNSYGLWTPDGRRIIYVSDDGLMLKSSDGTGAAERLTTRENAGYPSSWSPDGQTLAFFEPSGEDIFLLPLAGDRKPRPLVQTKYSESQPEFSPDGHWLAYTSNESGRSEVYARPYPGPGSRVQISIDGGAAAGWVPGGGEIIYEAGSSQNRLPDLATFMSVEVSTSPAFHAGVPKKLFERVSPTSTRPVRGYDISPDGRRFLMTADKARPPNTTTQVILVENWFDELKRLVPTK